MFIHCNFPSYIICTCMRPPGLQVSMNFYFISSLQVFLHTCDIQCHLDLSQPQSECARQGYDLGGGGGTVCTCATYSFHMCNCGAENDIVCVLQSITLG